MVALNFNSQQFSPEYGMIPQLPAGNGYKGMIVKTEGKPNSKTQGSHLELTVQVIEGPLTGKQQIDRLNLFNSNDKTVEIANKQLSAYCHVTGVFMIQDTDQLCGKPFTFDVAEQKENPQFTQIVAIYDINGNKPGSTAQHQQGPSPQAPSQPPPPVAPSGPVPTWSPPAPPSGAQAGWTPPPSEAPAQPPQQGGWGGAPGAPAQPGWAQR